MNVSSSLTTVSNTLLSMMVLLGFMRLPEEFKIIERWFSLTETFDISTDLETVAIARRQIFSLLPTFDLEDLQGRLLASSQPRLVSWGTSADVVDSQGIKIGRIEEEFWSTWIEYRISNAQDILVAIARMDLLCTVFELFSPDNPEHIYATIEKPFIRIFRDCWTVKIRDLLMFEKGKIDPRLLIMVAVHQTYRANRNRIINEIFIR